MIQKTLIFGVSLTAAFSMLTLIPRSPHHGAVLAMGDVRGALEKVNTWHLKGWKRQGDAQVPWEVWGRRSPFFYHERIGDQETLDDGKERTILFPPNAQYGNKKTVVLTLPSRPIPQSAMGLSFALGLDRPIAAGREKRWRSNADTETILREEGELIGQQTVQVNGLFTFAKGSPLPLHYERLMRIYGVPKTALGVYDYHKLPDTAIQKQWTSLHLDAEYNPVLDTDALHVTASADALRINGVQDATAPNMPTRNLATKDGLTLHETQAFMDAQGHVLLRFEGFVGNINFMGSHLPFGFDTIVRSGTYEDEAGKWQDTGYPDGIVAHDDRGRAYIAADNLDFLRYFGERAWLSLAPLVPLKPGEPLPRRMTFLMEMMLNTFEPLPELHSGTATVLVREILPFDAELPRTPAEIDLKALTRRYGNPANLANGFTTNYEEAAAEARADAWQRMAQDTLLKSRRYYGVPGQKKAQLRVDTAKQHEAVQMLRKAAYYTERALAQVSPREAQRIKSNMDDLKKLFGEVD